MMLSTYFDMTAEKKKLQLLSPCCLCSHWSMNQTKQTLDCHFEKPIQLTPHSHVGWKGPVVEDVWAANHANPVVVSLGLQESMELGPSTSEALPTKHPDEVQPTSAHL